VALIHNFSDPLSDTFLAGQPAIVIFGSKKDLLTNELAPIAMPSAIVIGPLITAPAPINTLFPICGQSLGAFHPLPIVTPWYIRQFSPILESECTTIVP
jgi:hypothetical protein